MFSIKEMNYILDNDKLDTVLSYEYINSSNENILNLLYLYGFSIWRSSSDNLIRKIEQFILGFEYIFVPVIQEMLDQNDYVMEIEQLHGLFWLLSENSKVTLKDNWMKLITDCNYNTFFVDDIKRLFEEGIISRFEFLSTVAKERERVDKFIKNTGTIDLEKMKEVEDLYNQFIEGGDQKTCYQYSMEYDELIGDNDQLAQAYYFQTKYILELNLLENLIKEETKKETPL